jgi:hypothetical protein
MQGFDLVEVAPCRDALGTGDDAFVSARGEMGFALVKAAFKWWRTVQNFS